MEAPVENVNGYVAALVHDRLHFKPDTKETLQDCVKSSATLLKRLNVVLRGPEGILDRNKYVDEDLPKVVEKAAENYRKVQKERGRHQPS